MGSLAASVKQAVAAERLPALSPVIAQLIATLSRPDVDLAEIETIIRRDPVIAARVVSAANAAAYAGRTEITTIMAAVARLGFFRIRRLAFYVTLRNTLAPQDRGVHQLFWRHSLAVAHACEALGQHLRPMNPNADPEVLFLAGLLHDIGFLFLATQCGTEYHELRDAARRLRRPLYEAEGLTLHVTHAEVGEVLARHWQLPDGIVAAIRWHHETDRLAGAERVNACVVRAADVVCSGEDASSLGEYYEMPIEECAADLDIAAEALPGVLVHALAEAKLLAQIAA